MAYVGQTLENPASGERITFREIAAGTDGKLVAIDLALPVGGRVVREFEDEVQAAFPSPWVQRAALAPLAWLAALRPSRALPSQPAIASPSAAEG